MKFTLTEFNRKTRPMFVCFLPLIRKGITSINVNLVVY